MLYEVITGKTAHGLVRRTDRYRILGVIDSRHADRDAGQVREHVHHQVRIRQAPELPIDFSYNFV